MDATNTFADLNLPAGLLEALTGLGFNSPTPIQAQAIPAVMTGKDLLAIAPTGTGKTGAFAIPAVASLSAQTEKQVLILAPTRELAAQIFKVMMDMGAKLKIKGALLVGGESFRKQYGDWYMGVDFIVATPGRLMDHMGRGLDLSHIGILVLDEVDRMLDMGFAPAVEDIVKTVPEAHQTLFFSATMPAEIQKLAARYLKDPTKVTVGRNPEDAPKIKEERVMVARYDKAGALLSQIQSRTGKVLVFARTQLGTDRVAQRLEEAGIEAARLHGGRSQAERKLALEAFRNGRVRVLIATDIAARGIDVVDIECVINFDRAATKEDHLHRIGRTGRCGKEGVAINFVDEDSPGFRPNRGGPSNFQRPRFDKPRFDRPNFGNFAGNNFAGTADRSAPRPQTPRPEFKRPEAPKANISRPVFEKPRVDPLKPEFIPALPANTLGVQPKKAPKPTKPTKTQQNYMSKRVIAEKKGSGNGFGFRRQASATPGLSGDVRFFRAGEDAQKHRYQSEEELNLLRPKKGPANFVRGKAGGSVRRAKQAPTA